MRRVLNHVRLRILSIDDILLIEKRLAKIETDYLFGEEPDPTGVAPGGRGDTADPGGDSERSGSGNVNIDDDEVPSVFSAPANANKSDCNSPKSSPRNLVESRFLVQNESKMISKIPPKASHRNLVESTVSDDGSGTCTYGTSRPLSWVLIIDTDASFGRHRWRNHLEAIELRCHLKYR